jgi:ATP-binding cassette subfamily G (WHITE) protein 1
MFFAALLPNVQVALAIFPVVFMPLMLVSGYDECLVFMRSMQKCYPGALSLFVNNSTIPVYIDWLKYLSPIKYGFEALVKNQFEGWTKTFVVQTPNGPKTTIADGETVISNFGMSNDGLTVPILILILISLYLGLTILAGFALANAARKKRSKR